MSLSMFDVLTSAVVKDEHSLFCHSESAFFFFTQLHSLWHRLSKLASPTRKLMPLCRRCGATKSEYVTPHTLVHDGRICCQIQVDVLFLHR